MDAMPEPLYISAISLNCAWAVFSIAAVNAGNPLPPLGLNAAYLLWNTVRNN